MREFGKKRPNSAIDFCWILIVSPCIYRGIVSLIINDENRSIDLSIWPSIEVNSVSIDQTNRLRRFAIAGKYADDDIVEMTYRARSGPEQLSLFRHIYKSVIRVPDLHWL